MNSNIKTTLLTGFLFFLLISGVKAQEKYDFTVVIYDPHHKEIKVSSSSDPIQTYKVGKEDFGGLTDLTPVLKAVAKVQIQGWELFNTQAGVGIYGQTPTYLFYLRKKQQ